MRGGAARLGRSVAARLLCRAGRHAWVTHHDPELSWEEGVFSLCRRCGRERQQYDSPPAGTVFDPGGLGGGGVGG